MRRAVSAAIGVPSLASGTGSGASSSAAGEKSGGPITTTSVIGPGPVGTGTPIVGTGAASG